LSHNTKAIDMTDCNGLPLRFSRLGRRNLQGIFDGGAITSDGGALLLREVDRAIGLIDSIGAAVGDARQAGKVTHDLRTLLAQRIYAIAMGYEDGNDHDDLRRDPLLQILAERGIDSEQPLASPSTLCRFENAVDRDSMARFAEVFVEQFLAAHDAPPEQIVLDFDATDDPVHGRQEGRSSTATTIITATCRCTSSAAGICCVRICGRARSTPPSTAGPFSNCWSNAFGATGLRRRLSFAATAASVGGSCCDGATGMA
jgi:hypothetical protein